MILITSNPNIFPVFLPEVTSRWFLLARMFYGAFTGRNGRCWGPVLRWAGALHSTCSTGHWHLLLFLALCPCTHLHSKAIMAACALVVHNAGRGIVESNFPCLEGPHLSLSNADAFAHSCFSSQCFPLSSVVGCCVRVNGRRLFSLAFLSLASYCQCQAMPVSKFRH